MTTAAPPRPAEEAARLSNKQKDSILDATCRICVWEGSIRSGKTIASILKWLQYVQTGPKGPLAIIGRTKETIARNVLDVIADILPGAISFNRGAPSCRILGRLVHIIGASDTKAEKVVRGLTLAGAYVDELTVIPEEFFVQLLGRLSVPGAQLFCTTNPDNPEHWVRKKYLKRANELNLATWHFILDDNPSLTEEYKNGIKSEFTGLWYKRFILGQWVAAEGAIYDLLDDTVHCRPTPDKDLWQAAWIALDYGTSNPTHAGLIVLAPDAVGQLALYVVSEWEHDGRAKGQLTDAAISKRLAEWAEEELADTGLDPVVALDPSAASLRTQMRADGWPGLRSADNRVDVGIRNTASLFGGGRLYVDQNRCPVLWEQLCGYVWDDTALANGEEKPKKVADHGCDMLRYGVQVARGVWRSWLPELAAADGGLAEAA